MPLNVTVTHEVDQKEWDGLIERFSGSFFLRPECLSMHEYDYLPCYFRFYESSQKVIGIAFGALIRSRRPLLKHLFRSLYLPTLPVAEGGSLPLLERMIREIDEYGRREKVTSIASDSFYAGSAYEGFESLGFKPRARWEFLWDLQGSER